MTQKAAGAPPRDVVGRRVVLHGRVQGVAFRAAVRSRAKEAGVAGWVRNNPDGTIEAFFEGPPDGVDELVEFVHAGSPGARVKAVDVSEQEPEGLQSFEVVAGVDDPAQAEAEDLPRIFFAALGRDDRDPFGSASWRVQPQVQAGDVLLFARGAELAYAARAVSEARAVEKGQGSVADLDTSSWFRLAQPISLLELGGLDPVHPGPLEEPVRSSLLRMLEERDPRFGAWLAGAALPSGRLLPGFAADTTEGSDLLGVQERVDFLASALAAKQLQTPLAVGLFGDWGSGKSFFMRRMQERIAELAERSAHAEEAGEESYYCSHVRQVVFNAWLYADSPIWPSLAARVFRGVSGDDPDAPDPALQRDHLSAYREGVAADVRQAAGERGQAEREEVAYEERIAELDAEIARKHAAITDRGVALGGRAGETARGLATLRDLWHRLGRILRSWRELRPADVLLLLAPLSVAALIWAFGADRVAALVAVLSPVLALLAKAIRYVDDSTQLQRELDTLTQRRTSLEHELEEKARLRAEAEGRLEAARAVPVLPEYAAEQFVRWAEREQLGVVTEIRLAFERLSRLIDESRAGRSNGRAQPRDHLPIDRVIVYVDDLDRCSHDVVVRVLESIKVLVDVPHFVVVVGVDARWLFRAIQVHFADVLRPEGLVEAGNDWEVTPQNYLEKIFQYSLVLRPLDAIGFERLIGALLTVEDEVDGDAAAPAAGETEVVPPADEGAGGGPVEAAPNGGPESGAAGVDLTPRDLLLTRAELEFIKGLAALYETPRAAKRLANVYRLVRVSVGAERLRERDSYEPLLVLLSVAIAYPSQSGALFAAVKSGAAGPAGSADWDGLVSDLFPQPVEESPGRQRNLVGELSSPEAAAWERLATALSSVHEQRLGRMALGDFAEWADVVADFSLHPWR